MTRRERHLGLLVGSVPPERDRPGPEIPRDEIECTRVSRRRRKHDLVRSDDGALAYRCLRTVCTRKCRSARFGRSNLLIWRHRPRRDLRVQADDARAANQTDVTHAFGSPQQRSVNPRGNATPRLQQHGLMCLHPCRGHSAEPAGSCWRFCQLSQEAATFTAIARVTSFRTHSHTVLCRRVRHPP